MIVSCTIKPKKLPKFSRFPDPPGHDIAGVASLLDFSEFEPTNQSELLLFDEKSADGVKAGETANQTSEAVDVGQAEALSVKGEEETVLSPFDVVLIVLHLRDGGFCAFEKGRIADHDVELL